MLQWGAEVMGPHLAATAEERFDATMIIAALSTAWFFMLRAKEYCESNGVDYAMIMRGVDFKIDTARGRRLLCHHPVPEDEDGPRGLRHV